MVHPTPRPCRNTAAAAPAGPARRRRRKCHAAPPSSPMMARLILLSLGSLGVLSSTSTSGHLVLAAADLAAAAANDSITNRHGSQIDGAARGGSAVVRRLLVDDPLAAVTGEDADAEFDDDLAELDVEIAGSVEQEETPEPVDRGVDFNGGEKGKIAAQVMPGEVASDSAETEETDVQEAAGALAKEAETEEEAPAPAAASAVPLSGSETIYPDAHRSAWVAHGVVGAVAFGLLVPLSISSALFRDIVPACWIYVHVTANVLTFALTFFAVGMAVATMHGMGDAAEGHMTERHHLAGLLLLLIVSFQTANGFLRPPREFVTDDEHDATPGAVLRSKFRGGGATARNLWHLVHGVCGLTIFGLGVYQVRGGLGLFARRFGAPDWGVAYVGYTLWLVGVVIVAKLYLAWKSRRGKKELRELQMGIGSNLPNYDGEDDFAVAKFETV